MRSLVLLFPLVAAAVLAAPTTPSTTTPSSSEPSPSSKATGKQVMVEDSTTTSSRTDKKTVLSTISETEEAVTAPKVTRTKSLGAQGERILKDATEKQYRDLEDFRNFNDYVVSDAAVETLLLAILGMGDDVIQAVKQARETYLEYFRSLPFDQLLLEELKSLGLPMNQELPLELVQEVIRKAREHCDQEFYVGDKAKLKDYNDAWKMDDQIMSILLFGDSKDAESEMNEIRGKYARATTSDAPNFERELEISKALMETRKNFPDVPDAEFAQKLAEALPEYGAEVISAVEKARNTLNLLLAASWKKRIVLRDIIRSKSATSNIPKPTFDKYYGLLSGDPDTLKVLQEHPHWISLKRSQTI